MLLGVVGGGVVDRHGEEAHHATRVAVLPRRRARALEVVVDLEVVEDAVVVVGVVVLAPPRVLGYTLVTVLDLVE